LDGYETVHHCVVPGSAKQFKYDDKDGLLIFRIVLLKNDYTKRKVFEDDVDKE